MDSGLNGFTAVFESEAGRRYLVMSGEGGMRITGFQVEMAANNKIPGVLAFEIKEKNAAQKIYYDLTGLINLPNYLEMPGQKGGTIWQLTSSITSILLDSGRYLLDLRAFVLQKDFVFVDPKSGQLYLVLLPAEKEKNSFAEFKSLVTYLVSFFMAKQPADPMASKIQGVVAAETFNLKDFSRQLAEMSRTHAGSGMPAETAHLVTNGSGCTAELDPPIPQGNTGGDLKSRAKLFSLFAICISGAVTAVVSGVVELPAAVLAVSILIIGAAILARTPKREPVQVRTVQTSQISAVAPPPVEETVLLVNAACAVLEGIDGGGLVSLDRAEYCIGRNTQHCDCVLTNRSIGRIHAKIKSLGGTYVLSDLNSKNGTYLNDVRIASNQEYEIKDGDKITFAEVGFRFWLHGGSRAENYQRAQPEAGEIC